MTRLQGCGPERHRTSPPTQTVLATKQVADLAGVHRSHAKAWLACFSCIFLVLESCLSRAAGGAKKTPVHPYALRWRDFTNWGFFYGWPDSFAQLSLGSGRSTEAQQPLWHCRRTLSALGVEPQEQEGTVGNGCLGDI